MLRPAAYARATPGTTPAATSTAERRMIIATISRRWAPSASRTPISCARCDTENDSSPWMPTPARTNAIAANAPSTRSCTDRDAVSRSTRSDSQRTFDTGCDGSARWTICRIAGTIAGIDSDVRTTRSFGRYPMIALSSTWRYET